MSENTGPTVGSNAELGLLPRASVKRSEWVSLSPEAQAKLLAITGDPGPEYRKQQALGRERALKAPLGEAACPHTGQCHPGHCPCMEAKAQLRD